MQMESRSVAVDSALSLEAYCFQGLLRPFSQHFHEDYVIGLVEAGERRLACNRETRVIGPGDMVLFGPGQRHGCVQTGGAFSYRGLHIPQKVMLDLAEELTGRRELPVFSQNVLREETAARRLRRLHQMVLNGGPAAKEEELLCLLVSLFRRYGQAGDAPSCRQEVEALCQWMETHYEEHLTLDCLARRAGLSKSALLRAFGREKGTTPYRYLESVRVNAAKRLLGQGAPPLEAALGTGFSDQSHFTNCFTRFLGLPPGAYRRGLRTDGGVTAVNKDGRRKEDAE